jgi:hypothetical protein
MEEVSEEPSLIEEILPNLYSAPHPLIRKLSQKLVPRLLIDADQTDFFKGAVIVPVSRHIISEFFRILLDNMAKYGEPDDCACKFECDNTDTAVELLITLTDRQRSGVPEGEGIGLHLLEEHARQGKFRFTHCDTSDQFITKVVFPNALKVSPQMTRD